MAEEYARDYDLSDTPQVVFLAMLLIDAVKLSILRGWMISIIESTLKALRWTTFQAWVRGNKGRILEARHQDLDSD